PRVLTTASLAVRSIVPLLFHAHPTERRPGYIPQQGQRLPLPARQRFRVSRRRSAGTPAARPWIARCSLLSVHFRHRYAVRRDEGVRECPYGILAAPLSPGRAWRTCRTSSRLGHATGGTLGRGV